MPMRQWHCKAWEGHVWSATTSTDRDGRKVFEGKMVSVPGCLNRHLRQAARAAMRFKANGNKAKFKMKTMNMNGKNDNKKMKNKNGIDVDKYGNEKVPACVVHLNQAVYFPDRWWQLH